MKTIHDSRGLEIRYGDIIVHPVWSGKRTFVREGTVCEIPGQGCDTRNGLVILTVTGVRTVLRRPDRCAVVSDFVTERDYRQFRKKNKSYKACPPNLGFWFVEDSDGEWMCDCRDEETAHRVAALFNIQSSESTE